MLMRYGIWSPGIIDDAQPDDIAEDDDILYAMPPARLRLIAKCHLRGMMMMMIFRLTFWLLMTRCDMIII